MEAAIQGIANIMHENVRELRSEQDEVIDLFQKMVETTNNKILYMDEQMRYQDSMLISQRELIIQLQTQMAELRNDMHRRSYFGITRVPAVIPYDGSDSDSGSGSDSDSDSDSDGGSDGDMNVSLRQGHPRSLSFQNTTPGEVRWSASQTEGFAEPQAAQNLDSLSRIPYGNPTTNASSNETKE